MDLSYLDLKRIREEYLQMSLNDLSKTLNYSPAYCCRAESSSNPPADYLRKFQLLLLERRVQILENIIKGAEHDAKFLKEFKAADDTAEKI